MPPETLDWLPRSVAIAVGGLVVFGFVVARAAEAKEKVAELLGPPGRWLYRRARARSRAKQRDLDRSIKAAFKDASDYKALHRRIDTLEGIGRKNDTRIKKLELVEAVLMAREDMTAEYLREDAQWHIDAAVAAAEQGVRLPPHRSYTRFCREYRAEHGLPTRRWDDD